MTVVWLAVLRSTIWAVLFYVAVRCRSRLSIMVVVLAWASNALTATDHRVVAGVIGAVNVAVIVYLLIDRLDKDPTHIRHVATAQVAQARREVHDCQADRASWEARAVAYKRLLEKHNITD